MSHTNKKTKKSNTNKQPKKLSKNLKAKGELQHQQHQNKKSVNKRKISKLLNESLDPIQQILQTQQIENIQQKSVTNHYKNDVISTNDLDLKETTKEVFIESDLYRVGGRKKYSKNITLSCLLFN